MKLILKSIKSLMRKTKHIAEQAQNTAEQAQNTTDSIFNIANNKMEYSNPACIGSFSMNRSEGVDIGEYSSTMGSSCSASGLCSHAEGKVCDASGEASHAEGESSIAYAFASHAEGIDTRAYGEASHAEGYMTYAQGNYSHVQGKHNLIDSENRYAHIVGNGTYNKRSNAYTLDWEGNAWYMGSIEGTAIILSSPSGTRYEITVDDTGTLKTTAAV